jgi:hypothetical protein
LQQQNGIGMPQKLEIDHEGISNILKQANVGFLLLGRDEKFETAQCAGSGVLARLGNVFGILTAAHVLDVLPPKGEIGIVRVLGRESQVQKKKLVMDMTDRIAIVSYPYARSGPDLGFLMVPEIDMGWLKAQGMIVDLGIYKERDHGEVYKEVIFGVVDEWTRELDPHRPNTKRLGIMALCGYGEVAKRSTSGLLDTLEFAPDYGADLQPPKSHEGVSGGGLWRVTLVEKDGVLRFGRMQLCGSAFWEHQDPDGAHVVVCHGDRSIFAHLVDKMREKWPACRSE